MSLQELNVRITGDASGLKAAATQSRLYLDSLGRSFTTIKASSTSAGRGSAAAFDRLKRSIDPVYAHTKRYEDAVAVLNSQLALFKSTSGAAGISTAQYGALLEQTAQSMFGVTAAQSKMNAQIHVSRFQSANLAAQFNDIGVMAAAGQNVFMTAIQQGTQLSQVLNTLGGGSKQQLKALGQAFISIINPTSLMTIAAVAGGAALIKWGVSAFKASENADELKKAFEELKAASTELDSAYATAVKSQIELREIFGDNAVAARELNKALLDLAILESQEKVAATNALIAASLSDLVDEYNEYLKQKQVVVGSTAAEVVQAERLWRMQAQITEEYGLTIEQARQLVTAYTLLQYAKGPEEIAAATQRFAEVLKLAADAGAKLSPELQTMAKRALEAAIESLKLRGMLDKVAEIERIISGIDLASNIDAGVDAAGRLVNKLGDVYEAARKASSIPFDPPFPIGAALPPGFGGASLLAPTTSPRPTTRTADDWSTPPGAGSGGGTDPYEAELAKLLESLASKEQLEMESFQRRQEVLEQALEERRITEEEYAALSEELNKQHNDKLEQLDVYRHGSALAQTGKFFGDMANAFASGNEKMQALGKKFAAIEALANAWRAFSQVLADPSLPWFAKIPAAAGVLAAGMNAVSALGGSRASAPAASGSGSGANSAGESRVTTFNFTLTNDPMGFGESFARQFIDQLNAAQRNGGQIRGVIA